MKKKLLSVILASLMIASSTSVVVNAAQTEVPVLISAKKSDDEALADAISTYKSVFGDTDDYEKFNHNIYSNNEYSVQYFELNWSKSKSDKPNICSKIGSDGVIYYYSSYNYNDYNKLTVPEIAMPEALQYAYDFVEKINPELISIVSKDYAEVSYNKNGIYTVVFNRMANDIEVKDDYVYVSVSHKGELIEYSRKSITNGVVTPNPTTQLDKESILESFDANLPMKLVYRNIYPDGYDAPAKVKLYYQLNNNYNSTLIDASTGLPYTVEYEKSGGNYFPESVSNNTKEELAMDNGVLTEAEKKAVEMQTGFITADEATAKLLSMDELNFNNTYRIISSSLEEEKSVYTDNSTYYWRIDYRDETADKNCYASINAETGIIVKYDNYVYGDYKVANEFAYTYDDCKTIANQFLSDYYADIADKYVMEDNYYEISPLKNNDDTISSYSFSYVRHINGVPFYNDVMYITINPDLGQVISFNYKYSDAEFPSADRAISSYKAADKYWSRIELKPIYVVNKGITDSKLTFANYDFDNTEKQLTLVYNYNKYCFVDAFSGKLESYNGTEYIPEKSYSYYSERIPSDIEKSQYKTEIETLLNMGVAELSATCKFNPNSKIKAGEFSKMIESFGQSSDLPEDFDCDALLTREEAIRLLVHMMGYAKVADLSNIFVTSFSDSDSIDDAYIGYIAIAQGFGILDMYADLLTPKTALTNGEAAALVYNYMLYMIK